jgi:hypothetical protein
MTLRKASYIVAIRQISFGIAVLMGTALLNERYGPIRYVLADFLGCFSYLRAEAKSASNGRDFTKSVKIPINLSISTE